MIYLEHPIYLDRKETRYPVRTANNNNNNNKVAFQSKSDQKDTDARLHLWPDDFDIRT